MKYFLQRIGLTLLLVGCLQAVQAQGGADVLRDKVERNPPHKFSDGKTTLEAYVSRTIAEKTKCCGSESIYLEVRVDADGKTTSARPMGGKSECLKKAAADVLKYVQWKADDSPDAKNLFFVSLKIQIDCKGGEDNKYVAIDLGTLPALTESAPKVTEVPKVESTTQPIATEAAPTTAPANTDVLPATENTTPPTEPQQPVGPTLAECNAKREPSELPLPKYKSTGEKKPDTSHNKTHLNTSGPKIAAPEHIYGEPGMAVFIKQKLRKAGVCELAHVFAELSINKEGVVTNFRVLNVNTELVSNAILPVLCELQFKPSSMQQRYYLEFKTDIDCEGKEKIDLEKVGSYFMSPEKKERTKGRVNAPGRPVDGQ